MAQTNDQRLEQLKSKYQSALNMIQQQGVRLQNLHVQDGKLFIRGIAPSQDAKNRVWDQIKLVDAQYNDVTADITVEASAQSGAGAQASANMAQMAGGGNAERGQAYTVRPGDTLSKISRQFYGDANQYMRIFEANRGQLKDPDQIRPGQELLIP